MGEIPSILIVDDKKGDRALHAHYIRRLLPEVTLFFAENGSEGFDIAKGSQPQLIISDYSMPVMDGLLMTRNLQSDEATRAIPVVIVTGEDSIADLEVFRETSAVAVFRKPIRPGQLEECVKNILGAYTGARP